MQGRAMDLSPAALVEYARADQRREYERLAEALAQMVYCRTLPPDDAYAWTRVLVMEARLICLVAPKTDAPLT